MGTELIVTRVSITQLKLGYGISLVCVFRVALGKYSCRVRLFHLGHDNARKFLYTVQTRALRNKALGKDTVTEAIVQGSNLQVVYVFHKELKDV